MTRNTRLLVALTRIADGAASTVALADLAALPERTARNGIRALMRQGLVWSPRRGRWQLTQAGREIAAGLMPTSRQPGSSDAVATSRSTLAVLWDEGVVGLLRSRDRATRRTE